MQITGRQGNFAQHGVTISGLICEERAPKLQSAVTTPEYAGLGFTADHRIRIPSRSPAISSIQLAGCADEAFKSWQIYPRSEDIYAECRIPAGFSREARDESIRSIDAHFAIAAKPDGFRIR